MELTFWEGVESEKDAEGLVGNEIYFLCNKEMEGNVRKFIYKT